MSVRSERPGIGVDVDAAGPAAPPRTNGELVFEAPWQARTFGLCLAVLEREGLGWDALRRHLVPVIDHHPDAPYYEQLAEALESLLVERGLVDAGIGDAHPAADQVSVHKGLT